MLRSLMQNIETYTPHRAVAQAFRQYMPILLTATDHEDCYKDQYETCRSSLNEEDSRLYRLITKIPCDGTAQSYEDFQRDSNAWLAQAAEMEKLYKTPLAKKVDDCLKYHVKDLAENIDIIKKAQIFLAEIQKIFANDAELFQHWSKLPANVKQKTISAVYRDVYSKFIHSKNYKKILSVNLILKSALHYFPKWMQFIENYRKDEYFGHLASLFCEHIETATPARTAQVIDFILDVGAKSQSKDAKEAVSHIINYGLHTPYPRSDKPLTIEFFERRYQAVRQIDQCHEKKHQLNAFDLHFIQMNHEFLPVYEKYPKLYWRLDKHKIYFKDAKYFHADNIVAMLELCEFIAPDEVRFLLDPILYKSVEITEKRIAKVIAIFSWIKAEITKDLSDKNKGMLRGFADRIIALWWDNPTLADKIFTLSTDRYAELCKLLQEKYFFANLDVSDFEEILTQDNTRLGAMTARAVTTLLRGNGKLKRQLQKFTGKVLAIADASSHELKSISLTSTFKKLPQAYLQVINKSLHVIHRDAKCLEQFFQFAESMPFSETLTRLLDKMQTVKKEKLLAKLKAFNVLVSTSPELLGPLITQFKSVNRLKELKNIDAGIYRYLLSDKIRRFNKVVLDQIISNGKLREKLSILMKVEEDLQISLIDFFIYHSWYPKMLSDTLVAAIREHKQFAIQLSCMLTPRVAYYASSMEVIFACMDKMLVNDRQELFKLFDLTKTYEHALFKLLESMSSNKPEEKLYPLLMKFYDAYANKNLDYIQIILGLIQNELDAVAIQLMEMHDNLAIKPHLQAIFNLILTLRIPTVKIILEKLQKNPKDVFINKVLILDGRAYSGLICHCLSVDPETDKDVYAFIMKTPVNQLTNSRFVDAMIHFARGNKDRVKDFISADKEMKIDFEPTSKIVSSGMEVFQTGKIEHDLQSTSESKEEKDESQSRQQMKFCLTLSKIVIEHHFDPDVIDFIKTTDAYKKLDQSPLLKNHLDDVLEIIKNNPEFSEALNKIQRFDPPPIALPIIKKMLNIPENNQVTLQHMQILAFAILLSAIRQHGKVGSCFINSVLIQATSYKEGLLRVLEDVLSLLTRDSVQRPNEKQVMTDYPVYIDTKEFIEEFEDDNLLLRLYEYAIAAITAGGSSLKDISINKIVEMLERNVIYYFWHDKEHSEHWSELISHSKKFLKTGLEEAILLVYSGHAKHVYTGEQGLWLLLDRETRAPFKNNDALQLTLFDRVFKRAKDEVVAKYPSYAEKTIHLFDVLLKNYVRSDGYVNELYRAYTGEATGLIRINYVKYRHLLISTPYVHSGGYSGKIVSKYYGCDTVIERLPFAHNPLFVLERLSKKIQKLSHEKLLLSYCHDHGFNIILNSDFYNLNATTLIIKMQDAAESLAKSALNESLATKLIGYYVNNQIYPDKNLAQLHWALLMKNVGQYHCLDDLMQAIVKTDRELMGRDRKSVRKVIEWIIRAIDDFKDKLPPLFMFADTNWENSHRLALTCFIHDRKMHTLVTTISGEVRKDSWDHGEIWQFCVVRYPIENVRLRAPYVRSDATRTLEVKEEPAPKRQRIKGDFHSLLHRVGIWKAPSAVCSPGVIVLGHCKV